MPHGPWDSGAWFNKMKATAMQMVETMTSANPLFNPFYELICLDLGVKATGDADHKAQIRQTIFANDAFRVKGDKPSRARGRG